MSGLIAFRADASQTLGHGHVMRCLALADALKVRGWRCLFIAATDGNVLETEVIGRAHAHATLPPLINEAADGHASAVIARAGGDLQAFVMDHYYLGADWQIAVGEAEVPLLVIDDLPRNHLCSALLDQNIVDGSNPYACHVPVDCQFFIGPHYALLRPEFARLRTHCAVRKTLHRILIFFGGSDPTDETGKAVAGVLAARGNWMVDVVVGASYPYREALVRRIAQARDRFRLHVQTSHMAELMTVADLAIGAGGSASWERCCLGLPAIVSVLSENQSSIADSLGRLGAVVHLGRADLLTAADYTTTLNSLTQTKLASLSQNSALLTDGLGAPRLAEALEQLIRNN